MLNLSALFKRAGKVAGENSPAILTAIGVTGTITTAVLAAKGAFEAVGKIQEAAEVKSAKFGGEGFEEGDADLTLDEKVTATWKCYVPAAATCAVTVAAIICSNRVSERRTAAVASAYAVVKDSYADYRKKTIETVGKKKEQDIRDAVAEDRMNANPVSQAVVMITNNGETLCYDQWTDRYFTSTKNAIDAARNEFNKTILHQGYASLAEFYDLLKLPAPVHTQEIGWDSDKPMELEYTGHIREDGTPALAFEFRVHPNPRFGSLY